MTAALYTIGHSTHSEATFCGLLKAHGITAVADVRTSPFSRFNPQFNKGPLASTLKQLGVVYVFLGNELGARTSDRNCYVDGKVDYARLAKTPLFQRGLERLDAGSLKYRIAIMCAEKDPLTCHRTILVARHLVERGPKVLHILSGGSIETHEEATERLLKETGFPQDDLFRDRQELLSEAYTRRAQLIAYDETEKQAEPLVTSRPGI